VESLALLPASPQIFHGRESELEDLRGILAQDYGRIAILGPGGMGKTTLALSVLHEPSTVSKYVHRYFVPCHSIPTCSELVSNIASHIGVDPGRNLAHRIGRHLSLNPPSLLILDNLETPWEPLSSRADVEELLSLLADVSHLAIVVSTATKTCTG
jgi:Cdc6-like AAA superfamily ATPase